jgi:ABC-type lipoprotein export system ATPase subunit
MIVLTSVTKVFQSGRGRTRALSDVSLVIEKGSFSAVIGKSGSGKSTLLHCIGGLEAPDSGTIRCYNTSVGTLSDKELSLFQRENIGFVFQRGNLLSYLTVAENIGFPLMLNGVTGREQLKRIEILLDRIGLLSAAKALPHELSGGETQRVAMARAVAHLPKILLADEPTASLDTETGGQVVQLMRELGQEHGCTIVMATHDVEITGTANPVFRLKDGRIHEEALHLW